jgi:hypothetical protein
MHENVHYQTINKMKVEVLQYPLHNPELAQSAFNIFGQWKKHYKAQL